MLEFGSSLRQSREAQGLSLADAEKATRVRSRYLRALEEGRLDELPGGSYPRAFLRDYANYLGLDPAVLLEGLPEAEPEISPRPEPPPIRPIPWFAVITAALILGCGAVVAVWALSARGHAPSVAPAAAAKPAAPVVRHRAAPPHVPAVAILRAARGDCWIRAWRGDQIVWQGMLRRGQTLRLGVSRRIVVRLGAPWNLDVRVAGKPLAGFPHRPVNVVLAA